MEKGAEGDPGAVESGSESEAEDKGIPSIKIELEEASEGDDEELSQSRSPESAKVGQGHMQNVKVNQKDNKLKIFS